MTEKNPEAQLVTLRCPCDDPNPCCSDSITSPKGLITVIIYQCQAFTEEDLDEDLMALYKTMGAAFEEGDDAAADAT